MIKLNQFADAIRVSDSAIPMIAESFRQGRDSWYMGEYNCPYIDSSIDPAQRLMSHCWHRGQEYAHSNPNPRGK